MRAASRPGDAVGHSAPGGDLDSRTAVQRRNVRGCAVETWVYNFGSARLMQR